MSSAKNAILSVIVRKWFVGLSGLSLVGFLIAHLAGNLLVLKSDKAINEYAHALHEIPFLALIELALLLMFLLHVALAAAFERASRRARGPDRYKASTSKRAEGGPMELLAAKAMIFSGIIVLGFLVVHIIDFRWVRADIVDVGANLRSTLAIPWKAGLYAAGSLLVGWHVFRGVQSGVRSLGFFHTKYSPLIHKAGATLAVLLALGFAAIPLWILIDGGVR